MQKAVTSGAVTFAMLLAMEPIKGVLDLELGNAGLLVNAALYVAYGALVGLIVSMVLEKKLLPFWPFTLSVDGLTVWLVVCLKAAALECWRLFSALALRPLWWFCWQSLLVS